MNVEKFTDAQHRLMESSYHTYRSYGYAAGYFQSLANQMFLELPKRKQAEFLRQMELDAKSAEARAEYTLTD